MITGRAPGVLYETVDAGGLAVTPFRTDIGAFVGIAERGPIDCPVPVRSWRQFVSWFGSFIPNGFLAYAVRSFFENGGQRCWIVRVASDDPSAGAVSSSAELSDAGGPIWQLAASSEGVWGDSLAYTLRERNAQQVAATSTSADGHYSNVPTTSGLKRALLVRIWQDGSPAPALRVVSDVDAAQGRVYWVNPEQRMRLPYDRALTEFDTARPLMIQSIAYSLLLEQAGTLIRRYDGLSLIPEDVNYGPVRLGSIVRTWEEGDNPPAPEPVTIIELRSDTTVLTELAADPFTKVALSGGRDGLSPLIPYDFVGEPVSPDDDADAVAAKCRGLRRLEEITEISLLAIPDAQVRPSPQNPYLPPRGCVPDPCIKNPPPDPAPFVPPLGDVPPTFGKNELFQIQSEMVLQCELDRYRFALLDPPFEASQVGQDGLREVQDWRARFDTQFAALYFPWVKVLDPLGTAGATRLVPPTGHVLGCVSASDLKIGVHKAPANVELQWALDSGLELSEERHAELNDDQVNAIRSQGSRGFRIMGARTLCSDPDWRFINVRRLVSLIEKALEAALQWAVFEPNDTLARARATMSATIFLHGLHEAGAFAGATPDESFFVKCDSENNPDETRDLGEMIIEIGIAPSKPMEFIVLRVGRVSDAIEVSEVTDSFSGAGVGT